MSLFSLKLSIIDISVSLSLSPSLNPFERLLSNSIEAGVSFKAFVISSSSLLMLSISPLKLAIGKSSIVLSAEIEITSPLLLRP
ncbi:hypothetical protein [Brachyspira murdochii]|uniref:hypothetical protein n=1 Tax=Brachyspira murdochii TaxID=84378 RepID=UPI0011B0E5E4|nr:hypothetical protein [Brachyspira murdochii]